MSSRTVSQLEGTLLTGRRLTIARALWLVLTIVYLVMLAVSIPMYWEYLLSDPYGLEDSLVQVGLSLNFFVIYVFSLNFIVIAVLVMMAILIFLRKSDDWMALLVSLMMVAIGAVTLPITGVLTGSGQVIALSYHALRALGVGIGLAVLFIFPNGRFVPGWTRYLLMLWFLNGLSWLFFPQLAPLPVPAEMRTPQQLWVLAFALTWFGAGLFAQVYRYNRTTDLVQRQQTKWVVFGFVMFLVGMFAISLPVLFMPVLRQPGLELMIYLLIEIPFVILCFTLVPLTIMISILKYQLWDIDALIRRTLAYSVLTVTLAGLYFISVLMLQALFNWLVGQAENNLALVGSTLAIAAAFNPLRTRIQGNIDRRFYRRKYDAERLVASFGASLRDEVEIDQLANRLLLAVQETFQPDGAELWLVDVQKSNSLLRVTRSSLFPRRL